MVVLTEMGILVQQTVDACLCGIAALLLLLLWCRIIVIHQDEGESLVPSTIVNSARVGWAYPLLPLRHLR